MLYQLLKTMKVKKDYDISKKLLIIDNNPTFVDFKDNFLLCPTYNYIQFSNLWEDLSNKEYFPILDISLGFSFKTINLFILLLISI